MSKIQLGFDGVEEAVNTFKERIEPGVHEIKILSVTGEENTNGKAYVSIKCENLEGTRSHEEKMWATTPAALDMTAGKLKHLIKAATGKEIKGTLSVEVVNKVLVNQKVRVKFTCEESEYNGEIYLKTSFGFKGFAESLSVPADKTGLKYDPNNKWDFRRAVKIKAEAVNYDSVSEEGETEFADDDPF